MKLSLSLSKFKVRPDELNKSKFAKLFNQEVQTTVARLRKNTDSGRGADGQAIKPGGYSQRYIDAINSEAGVRAGKSGVRKPNADVNLQISGAMLNSVQVKSTPEGAEAFFLGRHYSGLSNAELAAVQMERGFEGWFEFGQEDIKRIEESVAKEVERQLQKAIETDK